MKSDYHFNTQKSLLIFMFFLVCLIANSQEYTRSKLTLAMDVTPFLYEGYSAKVGFIPKSCPKLDIALEVFSINIP